MPTLPDWATGGRIVWDDVHGLAFIRHGLRRSPWTAYVRTGGGYALFQPSTRGANLAKLHKEVLEKIGDALGEFALSLHPGAGYAHMKVTDKVPMQGWTATRNAHACGIDYANFNTADTADQVTCPTCLAILAEDIKLKAVAIGPEAFEAKREHVRTIRAFNAFGRVVGDDPEASF